MSRFLILFFVTFCVFKSGNAYTELEYSDLKDFLQIGGSANITHIKDGRSAKNLDASFEDYFENFLKSNEISLDTPFQTIVTVSGRNLDLDELNLKLHLSDFNEVQARKKSRIKKVLAPIVIVLFLKAITLIPLALGVLGIKTWNALQLSFVSFVTSIALAVWKLCTKFSHHHQVPHIIHEAVHDVHVPHVGHDHHVVHHDHHLDEHHHDPWDHPYHRSDEASQQIAYNAYTTENKM
ncbi:hypothetical protein ABEB36_008911 [Hypothenemus hampei]|uniref:Osiris 19 n=1 Tax=Hypothenemus hampei TaxID=57062 RepID=A0ABD1ENX0_HYPHA